MLRSIVQMDADSGFFFTKSVWTPTHVMLLILIELDFLSLTQHPPWVCILGHVPSCMWRKPRCSKQPQKVVNNRSSRHIYVSSPWYGFFPFFSFLLYYCNDYLHLDYTSGMRTTTMTMNGPVWHHHHHHNNNRMMNGYYHCQHYGRQTGARDTCVSSPGMLIYVYLFCSINDYLG